MDIDGVPLYLVRHAPMAPALNLASWRAIWASSLLVALALSGTARASLCTGGCFAQRRVCREIANRDRHLCKGNCLERTEGTSRGECVRQCLRPLLDAEDTCRFEARVTCRQICDGSTRCIEACGKQLRLCGKSAVKQARRCLRSGCRGQLARLACFTDCLTALRAGAAGCFAGLNACAPVCRGESSTSTTSTTLPGSG